MGKPKKKENGYKMPEAFPKGIILEDIMRDKWKLGSSIGKGGFGEIYEAQKVAEKSNYNYPYVIKIEPHENGPLFVEMHFYMRVGKKSEVECFKKEKGLKSFGMPSYISSGSHEYNKERYRFLVMDKYGKDLWTLFLENNRHFPVSTVFKIGKQILLVLEYLHSKKYIHADIKGANILLGSGNEANKQVYLVDFGLATHYVTEDKPDPKKAHNGTIEYLSRDAHLGIESRRGDLEILGYNLVQWLGYKLPWESNLSNQKTVQALKNDYMKKLPNFFKACSEDEELPASIHHYFEYVINLKIDQEPDYDKLQKILEAGIKEAGDTITSPLKFGVDKSPKRKQSPNKDKSAKKIKLSPKKKKETKDKTTKEETPIEESPHKGENAEMKRIREKLKNKGKKASTKSPLRTSDRLSRQPNIDYKEF